jgi:arginine utilization protein RocB
MKKLIFLLVIIFSFSNLMAAQNADSLQLKENLVKLNQNLKEIKEFSKKIEKQVIEKESLLLRFKKFLSSISDNKKLTTTDRIKIDSLRVALKPDEYPVLIPSQEPQIEQRPKTFFGRLWSKNKFREYRYILTADSVKIYIQ